MCALALWTGCVLTMTGLRRVLAVRTGRLHVTAFRLGESAEVPEELALPNRNLMNLLEMPVLFYVVCIAFYVTGRVNQGVIVLGWSYVALRLVHSAIHLTTNRVSRRFAVFAASNIVLVFMWIRFIRSLL